MSVNRMLSKKEEQRSFSNGPLRDQWEQRAQSMADQCKQEDERREKSALKGLHSKWTYHWSLGSNGDMSDFSKLTCKKDEDNNKPKIKFKIVPPPPKAKPEPPPPPPPPRRKASPKPRRPKRKVEVDVFRLCWKESWMSLKPPKYLYLKARELRNRISQSAAIELADNGKYKAKRFRSEAELTSPQDKWVLSWKQVKSPAQMKHCEGNSFQWEILFERELVCKVAIAKYSLPAWAGTWKIMNFAFRQQKQKWDQTWPENFTKKSERYQQLQTQDEFPRWECSWKLSGPEVEFQTTSCIITVRLRMDDVFLPDWSHSWLLSAAPPEDDAERRQSWGSSWGFRQQIRWRKASLRSHHQHSDMLTKRRRTTSLFLMSQLDDEIPDVMEWMEAWITPKGCAETQDNEQQEEEEEKEADRIKNQEDKGEIHNMVNIATYDEGEKDEGVDEEEEGEEKEDEEEENEGLEYADKNEEDNKERDGGAQKKKQDVDVRQLDIIKLDKEDEDDKEEEDEGVDEEEEEDEVSEKEEDTSVEEEDKKDKEKDSEEKDEEENIHEEDRNKVQIDEEDEEEGEEDEEKELDEEEDSEQNDEEEEDKELGEEEDSEQNDEEEDIHEEDRNKVQIEEDEEEEEGDNKEVEEKVKNINKGYEEEDEEEDEEQSDMEAIDEGEDEELNVGVENKVVDEEEEENDTEGHEEEEVDDDDEVNERAENQAIEKENEKNKQRQVKCKPDTPLHLQFHKLNASFSSWRKSWMVAVAHRGGQDNNSEEEDEEEKQDCWAWRESWRIYRWKRPDEDEVVSFSSKHRFQRYVGLTHEADALPRTEWAVSWKMRAAVRGEEEDEAEDTS